MIKFRWSISVVLFFLLAIFGTPVPVAFALTGLLELMLVGIVIKPLIRRETINTDSFMGIIVAQYSDGDYIDPFEMLHICGARILSALLGFFAVWYYIPAVIVFLTTITDFVPKNKKPRK